MKYFDKDDVQIKLEEYSLTKSVDTRNEIVMLCSALVESIALKYASMDKTLNINDLKSYGYEGLIFGIETYNKELGNFTSYFCICIKNIIRNEIEALKGYPQTYYWDFLYHRRPIEKELDEYLEFDSAILDHILDEISKRKIFSKEKCNKLRNAFYINNALSIEQGGLNITIDTDEVIDNMITKEDLHKALNLLDEREKKIIMLRYGFINNRIYTLRELEEFYSITHEGIRKIEQKALKKIKVNLSK